MGDKQLSDSFGQLGDESDQLGDGQCRISVSLYL